MSACLGLSICLRKSIRVHSETNNLKHAVKEKTATADSDQCAGLLPGILALLIDEPQLASQGI